MQGKDIACGRHVEGSAADTAGRPADDALAVSERRYRRLFEAAKDGILILDAETGMVVDVNPFLIDLLGFSHEAFLNKKVWELGPFKDIVGNEIKFAELQRLGYVRYENLALETRDRRRVEVEFVSNVYQEGLLNVVQCNIRDITARKRTEEALRESRQMLDGIINAMTVRIFWKDRQLVYLGCNIAFARDAGFADPSEVIGKDDFEMGWRDQAERYRADDRQVIESGCSKPLIEEPLTTPTGDIVTLLSSKVPLRDAQGEISGVLGTYLDITERKQVEDALREQKEELQHWYEVTLGREGRVLELKQEVNALLAQAGQPPRYLYSTDATE